VIAQLVTRFAAGLRFPVLFALVAGLFLLDVVVPDLIPFVDEVLLALGTLLVGSLRKRRSDVPPPPAADSSKIK
jgi:Family of unknown function (DUF6116)